MALALKKSDAALVSESLAARSALKLARSSNCTQPIASPARELQVALADRLNESPESPAGAKLGAIVGMIGGIIMTGLLIYAATS